MKVKSLFASVLVVLLVASLSFAADTYKTDPAHSAVTFAVKHMMLATVKGKFDEFEGTIVYDEEDITKSSVTFTIKAASINTGNESRDKDLRGANFFEVEKYPEITFKSKQIVKEGDGYVAIGDLTMHGVTKEVKIPFTFLGKVKDPWGNTRIGVEGSLTLNRQDYGISYSRTLDNGGLVVGNEVKVEFSIEAIKQAT